MKTKRVIDKLGRSIPVKVGRTFEEMKESFRKSFDIIQRNYKTPCWEWNKTRESRNYGTLFFNGKKIRASRFSWQIHRGFIPDGLCVLHSCDNPPCVNPDHLFLGTMTDNTADRHAKNRDGHCLGESHGMAKLTNEDILKIRSEYQYRVNGGPILGPKFGVDPSLITMIVRHKIWKHI